MDGSDPSAAVNPLNGSARDFDRLIETLGPATLLLVIERRMGAALRARMAPEDILQEALLHAWRDRGSHRWQGLRTFRAWLLSIIDHRISDGHDRAATQKRGGDARTLRIDAPASSVTDGRPIDVPLSTTPSRIAWQREQADTIQLALEELPEDVREVVRLRLVEQANIEEIATRLGLGSSAVRHRFRRGAELFRHRLTSALGTRDGKAATRTQDSATARTRDSSSC